MHDAFQQDINERWPLFALTSFLHTRRAAVLELEAYNLAWRSYE